ncbi:hypothetical protein CBER1_03357 [Cercospora berteroae]|uniref:Metallo-beta-lactamase domain-containing protein n=1 Tax=Cercospora berteroae TaxID=357750 RepID=A0A2S6BQT1_9PEZI|nr:hypothetical protein CBER1_03357 [Cercospora berteroae]
MSQLRAAVHVAPPTACQPGCFVEKWSPTSCTLVYDDKNAVLVDTPITVEQNENLLAWILETAPGRNLETIYITHGHPDHWFGLPIMLKKFPNAKVLATAGTIKRAKDDVNGPAWAHTRAAWFLDHELPEPYVFPELLTGNKFLINMKLVVAGDVVYGQVHQMHAIGTSPEQRAEWLAALDIVEKLKPSYVVAGHQQAGEMHGPWTIPATRQYIKDFEKVLDRVVRRGGNADDAYEEMMKLRGERANPGVLKFGFGATFAAIGKQRAAL